MRVELLDSIPAANAPTIDWVLYALVSAVIIGGLIISWFSTSAIRDRDEKTKDLAEKLDKHIEKHLGDMEKLRSERESNNDKFWNEISRMKDKHSEEIDDVKREVRDSTTMIMNEIKKIEVSIASMQNGKNHNN